MGEGKKRKEEVTNMLKFSEQEIEKIVSRLREGKTLLFDTKKEYELIYFDKEREEDILADTMAVPLQKIKTFRNGASGNSWTNMLIFGDNLQILKTLLQMKQEGKLKNADGTPGVRLVYIDPPFATRQEFRGSQDQKAYQDKIAGARFLEFLRKRLVFLRELLSEDGGIYVHLDYHKKHYVKAILDELFGENNFRNEIVVNRIRKNIRERERVKKLNEEFDTLLLYSRNDSLLLLPPTYKNFKSDRWHAFDAAGFRNGMDYEIFGFKPASNRHWHWTKEKAFIAKSNYVIWEKNFLKNESLGNYWLRTGKKLKFVRPNTNTGKPEYFIPASEDSLCNNLWNDISGYSFSYKYPTEKNELLLERIINMASAKGDLILDAFAGSGTTLAVAEKLGRRWIGVDCGKLAIYTMQKRLLNIADSKDLENPKKKYGKPPKPFILYNAGLYDYKMIKKLPWEQYRDFALKLFQCRDEKHKISKIELDGYLGADSVMVFNYQKHPNALLHRGFIDDLYKYLGDKIGRRFFIIVPAASVQFLEDYIEKGKTKYFILRIPYSIIEEIHNRGFSKIKQPVNEMDVNDTVDAVGFDFIQVPTVECRYFGDNKKGQLKLGKGTKECVIKIEKFESRVISCKPLEFINRETLSMVMLDYNFDREVFNLDEVFYAEELKEKGYEVRFAKDKVKGQIMVIYIDIFGNEKREIKTLSDFSSRGKESYA